MQLLAVLPVVILRIQGYGGISHNKFLELRLLKGVVPSITFVNNKIT